MSSSPQRLALMGGTFNPIHLGHLRAAEEIAESLELAQIHFMPSAHPPHKEPAPLADFKHRVAMLKLAVAERPGFFVSELENHLPSPSFTLTTVLEFKKRWPTNAKIHFVVGLDSFMTLPSWYSFRELLAATSFVVFARAGIDDNFDSLAKMLFQIHPEIKWHPRQQMFTAPEIEPIHFHSGGRLAISSTMLRQNLENGSSVRYLVPEAVRNYIQEHGLYRQTSSNIPLER